jgi:hypothetical protein
MSASPPPDSSDSPPSVLVRRAFLAIVIGLCVCGGLLGGAVVGDTYLAPAVDSVVDINPSVKIVFEQDPTLSATEATLRPEQLSARASADVTRELASQPETASLWYSVDDRVRNEFRGATTLRWNETTYSVTMGEPQRVDAAALIAPVSTGFGAVFGGSLSLFVVLLVVGRWSPAK